MEDIARYPNTMPKEINKWLPKIYGNNVITTKWCMHAIGRDMKNEGVEHEDVAMKVLATSLTEDSQR
jgi:hypothetical protein